MRDLTTPHPTTSTRWVDAELAEPCRQALRTLSLRTPLVGQLIAFVGRLVPLRRQLESLPSSPLTYSPLTP